MTPPAPPGSLSPTWFSAAQTLWLFIRDSGLSILSVLLMLGVAAAGWAGSFIGLHDFAVEHMDLTETEGWLVPTAFDGAALGLSIAAARAAMYGRSALGARALIAAFTALSSWINWLHIDDTQGRIVSALLPVAAVVLFEAVLSEMRAASERRSGRVRPRLHPMRWVVDAPGTWAIYRSWILDIPLPQHFGADSMESPIAVAPTPPPVDSSPTAANPPTPAPAPAATHRGTTRSVVLATLLATAIASGITAAISAGAQAVGVDATLLATLAPVSSITMTGAVVFVAAVGWTGITIYSTRPDWLRRRLTLIAAVASLLAAAVVGVNTGWSEAVAFGLMHLTVLVVTVTTFRRLLRGPQIRPASYPVALPAAGGEEDLSSGELIAGGEAPIPTVAPPALPAPGGSPAPPSTPALPRPAAPPRPSEPEAAIPDPPRAGGEHPQPPPDAASPRRVTAGHGATDTLPRLAPTVSPAAARRVTVSPWPQIAAEQTLDTELLALALAVDEESWTMRRRRAGRDRIAQAIRGAGQRIGSTALDTYQAAIAEGRRRESAATRAADSEDDITEAPPATRSATTDDVTTGEMDRDYAHA